MELPVLGWKLSEREQNRPLACNLVRFLGLIVPVFRLIAQNNEKTLNAWIAPEEKANSGIRIGQTSN